MNPLLVSLLYALGILAYIFIGMVCSMVAEENNNADDKRWWEVTKAIFTFLVWPLWIVWRCLRIFGIIFFFTAVWTAGKISGR